MHFTDIMLKKQDLIVYFNNILLPVGIFIRSRFVAIKNKLESQRLEIQHVTLVARRSLVVKIGRRKSGTNK